MRTYKHHKNKHMDHTYIRRNMERAYIPGFEWGFPFIFPSCGFTLYHCVQLQSKNSIFKTVLFFSWGKCEPWIQRWNHPCIHGYMDTFMHAYIHTCMPRIHLHTYKCLTRATINDSRNLSKWSCFGLILLSSPTEPPSSPCQDKRGTKTIEAFMACMCKNNLVWGQKKSKWEFKKKCGCVCYYYGKSDYKRHAKKSNLQESGNHVLAFQQALAVEVHLCLLAPHREGLPEESKNLLVLIFFRDVS